MTPMVESTAGSGAASSDLTSLDFSQTSSQANTAHSTGSNPVFARASELAAAAPGAAVALAHRATLAYSIADLILSTSSGGISAALLRGALSEPLRAAAIILGIYIVWLPLGALAALVSWVFTTIGAICILAVVIFIIGSTVARVMVFPGSVSGFSLQMERAFATRFRNSAADAARDADAAIRRLVAAARPARSGGSATALAVALRGLRCKALSSPSSQDTENTAANIDLIDLKSKNVTAAAATTTTTIASPFAPAASAGPIAELVCLRDVLVAQANLAAHPQPWSPPPTPTSQHAAILLHTLETALALIEALQEALKNTAPDADVFADPFPLQKGAILASSPLNIAERARMGRIPVLSLLFSSTPLGYDESIPSSVPLPPTTATITVVSHSGGDDLMVGTTTSDDNLFASGPSPLSSTELNPKQLPPLSLALTAAATIAALRRFRALSAWLEIVPHNGWGAYTSLKDVTIVAGDTWTEDGSGSGAASSGGGRLRMPATGSAPAETPLSPPVSAALNVARNGVRDAWHIAICSHFPNVISRLITNFTRTSALQAQSTLLPSTDTLGASEIELGPLALELGLSPRALRVALDAVTLARAPPLQSTNNVASSSNSSSLGVHSNDGGAGVSNTTRLAGYAAATFAALAGTPQISSSSRGGENGGTETTGGGRQNVGESSREEEGDTSTSDQSGLIARTLNAFTFLRRAIFRTANSAWRMVTATSAPSPIAGLPLLRAELVLRTGAHVLAIPTCSCDLSHGGGGGGGSTCDGRYVDALFIPAGTASVALTAWAGTEGFAPSIDVAPRLPTTASTVGTACSDDVVVVTRENNSNENGIGGAGGYPIPPYHNTIAATIVTVTDSPVVPPPPSSSSMSAPSSPSLCRRRGGSSGVVATVTTDSSLVSEDVNDGSLYHRIIMYSHTLFRTLTSRLTSVRSRPPPCIAARWSVMDTSPLISTRSTRRTIAILCAPNAGSFEGALRYADAVRFYTLTLGIDVLLWNYAGYGRPIGGIAVGASAPCKELLFGPSAGWNSAPPRLPLGGLSPEAVALDSLAVGTFARTVLGARSLIAHGESLGGTAAAALGAAGIVDAVVCDRAFDSLHATAGAVVGSWAGPALRLITGWAAGAGLKGTGNMSALASALVNAVDKQRPLVIIAANDAQDAVIANQTALGTALACATILRESPNGDVWSGENAENNSSSTATLSASPIVQIRNRAGQSLSRMHQSARSMSQKISRNFSTTLKIAVPPPAGASESPPPLLLAALRPLPEALAGVVRARAEAIYCLLIYIAHEVLWTPPPPPPHKLIVTITMI